ncbi:MAG: hypothetical protein K9G46_07075 [Flavobacteriales bacterium]|nr:hypothetical protein [Flavobacteriales bacterium]
MQQKQENSTGQRSALDTAIIGFVKEKSAHELGFFLEFLYRNALEGSELSQYNGIDHANAFATVQDIRHFLIELESAAIMDFPEIDPQDERADIVHS